MLTVCVIGRNEAKNLPRLIKSLDLLNGLPFRVEKIFIDSASSDSTLEIAQSYFNRVCSLEESANLCASAGRFIGTLKSSGEWILYLDGDMQLCADFIAVIERTVVSDYRSEGAIGKYCYIYGMDNVRDNALSQKGEGKLVNHFGGAVLLPRDAVITATWDPCIFSNEEIELYTRLRANGVVVRFFDVPMIAHFTRKLPKWKILVYLFVPSPNGLGKKFFGIGQVLAARTKSRSLCSLIRFFPYPFVFWTGLLLAIVFIFSGHMFLGVLAVLAVIAYITVSKSPSFLILYLAFIVQALLGWRKYDQGYIPVIRAEYQNQHCKKQEK